MPNTYQIGRLGRLYVAEEPSFGTAASLAATDALRHLSLKFASNPRNRVNSMERHAHPSQVYRFTRRQTAGWMVGGTLFPSGTLNTLPDMDPILTNMFGAKTNVTLSTTVSASPSPTATVFTVAAVTGLAVGDAVLVNVTGGGLQVRWITAIDTLQLTVAPALSAAPTAGDAVKGCISYKLTTALGASLNLAHYRPNVSYEIKGGAPESLKIMVDANDEVMFEASGPAKSRTRPAQSDPSTFTTVGTVIPSGLTGYMRSDATAEEFLKASFELKNGIDLDNLPVGISAAQAMYRARRREVIVNVDTMVSDDVTLLALAEGTTDSALMVQCGLTQGSIVAWYNPIVEFDVPDEPDADGVTQHSFKGIAKGSIAGNNEIYLALA